MPRPNTLRGAAATLLALGLAAGALACGGGGGKSSAPSASLVVVPETTSVRPGATFQFGATVDGVASTAVAWSVKEAGGGTITPGGLYTAPQTNGAYTVVATLGGNTAQARVLVGPSATVTGTVLYHSVPTRLRAGTGLQLGGLDFANATWKPVRGAEVEIFVGGQSNKVKTDGSGVYTLAYSQVGSSDLQIFVKSKLQDGTVLVVDSGSGLVFSETATLPATGGVKDFSFDHGFTGVAPDYYDATRKAGPFAILDAIYTAQQKVLAAQGTRDLAAVFTAFPLTVKWSPTETNGTFYQGSATTSTITANGKAGFDTDEFDTHVIVHEWSHYIEDRVSRSDSIGGAHTIGDRLDPRVSFGEGYGDGLPSLLLPETIYVDSRWPVNCYALATPASGCGFGWDVAVDTTADDPVGVRGPFSETSVMRLLYRLFATGNGGALTLTDLLNTLTGPQANTDAFTTIASFLNGLKGLKPSAATFVDTTARNWNIGGASGIADEYGTGDPQLGDVMYIPISVGGGSATTTLATIASGTSCPPSTDIDNSRAVNQFVRFTTPATVGNLSITTAAAFDVDTYLYRRGLPAGLAATGPTGNESATLASAPANTRFVGWLVSCASTSAGQVTVTLTRP